MGLRMVQSGASAGLANEANWRAGWLRCTRSPDMNQSLFELSRQYVAALRRYLQLEPGASLRPALKLGRQAMALGLETLDLARMHVQATATLKLASRTNRLTKQAGIFLTEALVPFVGTHRSSRQGKTAPEGTDATMGQGGTKMAAKNLQLKRSVIRHKAAEASLKKRGERCTRLLKGSLPKQEGLRQLTHRLLLAQENQRQKLSHQLQDEIAQTLLSINVHLLNLRMSAKGDQTSLLKEIARAQRLVEDSIKSINRFACELDAHQPV